MKALRIAAAFLVVGPVVWIVAASAIYCRMSKHWDLFTFPWMQWAQAAPWWRLNWQMTLWITSAAAAPTLLLLIAIAVAIRLSFPQNKRPALYGQTEWARPTDMIKRNIRLTRKPL